MTTRQLNLRRSWRDVLVAIAVAAGGAALGLVLTPQRAVASTESSGWTCFGTDRCHEGAQACCNDPTTEIVLTHCTTMCDGGPG